MPDPDAPDCPESIRFWCSTTSKFTDKERVKVSGSCTAKVKTTADGVASLLDARSMPSISSVPPGGRAELSLADLANVVKESKDAMKETKKGKAKAKPKAKVKVEQPTDLDGKKTAARTRVRVYVFRVCLFGSYSPSWNQFLFFTYCQNSLQISDSAAIHWSQLRAAYKQFRWTNFLNFTFGNFIFCKSTIWGKELKKENNNCSCLFDLPQRNSLRAQLSETKAELEQLVDQLLGSLGTVFSPKWPETILNTFPQKTIWGTSF